MSERQDIDLAGFERQLLDRREELSALAKNSEEARAPVALDQTMQGRLSRMDAMQGQAMAQETERRRMAEIGRIDAALKRIGQGDYGYCVTCDEPIAEKRLRLDPSIPTCIACAGGSV
ncbi:TraR/DksA family transcriptional regulator [Aestuariispira insulae]|nr:TraR/DksA C4-type zinc finger protein [Aestuariispira insulae]